MRTLSITTLTLAGAASAMVGALVTYAIRLRGGSYLLVTPLMPLLFLTVAVALWYWGRRVVAYKEKRIPLDITTAVNVAYLSYSAAWTGTLCGGALIGMILPMLATWESSYVQQAIWRAAIAAVTAIAMTVIAVIVERWCRRDEDENERPRRERLEPEAS